MQCAEFEDRLNRLLDHRLAPEDDAALTDHAHDCEECASLFHAQQRLFVGLKQSRVQASVELAARVVAQQHWEVTRRRSVWRSAGWAVLLASAASLGGLALMALGARDNQPPVTKAPPVKVKGSGLAIANLGTNKASDDSKADEKFEEYFVVLENFATQIGESKEFDEVSESLEPGIKPIRSSFGLAIDALRRTLPRGKDNRPAKSDAGASWLPELPAIS
jgi:hypothetical protein